MRSEEKPIARNQHHIVIEGVEHPRHDAVKPLKVRWVVPNLAAEEGLSVRFAAQHDGLRDGGLCEASLQSSYAAKHGGFVFTHATTFSTGKDDSNGHGCIPQCMLSSSSRAFSAGTCFRKPFKQATHVLCIALNGPFQYVLKDGVFGRKQAFHHGLR